MDSLNVDHLIKIVQSPFVELAKRYGNNVALIPGSLESLFWVACIAEIKMEFGFEVSMQTIKKCVVISTNPNNIETEIEVLSGIELDKNKENIDLVYIDSEGESHAAANSSLFLACTARRAVSLGPENVELLKKYSNVEDLFSEDGDLKKWPRKIARQADVLNYISCLFNVEQKYSESHVDQEIRCLYSDYALIRRSLVAQGYMCRTKDGSSYWLKEGGA